MLYILELLTYYNCWETTTNKGRNNASMLAASGSNLTPCWNVFTYFCDDVRSRNDTILQTRRFFNVPRRLRHRQISHRDRRKINDAAVNTADLGFRKRSTRFSAGTPTVLNFFFSFRQSFHGNDEIIPRQGIQPLPSKSFPNSLFTNHHTIPHYIVFRYSIVT
jgi:hypothetical protein